jgi:hypothetical protein
MVAPGRYATSSGHDVVIFDRYVPASPPGVPAFYLGPNEATGAGPLAIDGEILQPAFDRIESRHPILRFVALRDVNIARALRVKPQAADQVLAADPRGPLLVLGRRADQPFLALTFDVRESDLPLRTAWPLLLLDALDFLTAREAAEPPALEVGRPQQITLPDGTTQATLEAPGSPSRAINAPSGSFVLTPTHSGFHRLRTARGDLTLAANLSSAGPTDLTPRERLTLDRGAVAERPVALPASSALPPWSMLLLGVLVLLAIELYTFHRRWTV